MNEDPDFDQINPESWTQKELLKHLYREIKKLSESIEQQNIQRGQHDTKISENTKKISQIEARLEEKEKHIKNLLTIFAIGLTTISIFIGVLFKVLGV